MSNIKYKDTSEEFKKVASKPFEKKVKKETVSAEVSTTRTGLLTTAINSSDNGSGFYFQFCFNIESGSDNGKINFMGATVPTTMNILDENKVNFSNNFWKVTTEKYNLDAF